LSDLADLEAERLGTTDDTTTAREDGDLGALLAIADMT
jgi:hypothetical protein